jgi:hypothetical protein
MSNLSFESFIRTARENQGGTVRIAKGDPDQTQLVNKGTIGNKVASFFDNIGRLIGSLFGGVPDTREQRNQTALENFREALSGQFGQSVAQDVLLESGFDEKVELTGKDIIEISDRAMAKISENRSSNLERIKDCLPLDYHDDYGGGSFFGEICQRLGVTPDLAMTLPREKYEAYRDRLITAFRHESELNTRPLTDGESKDIAVRVLGEIMELSSFGRLEGAEQARLELEQSVVELIVSIANHSSAQTIMDKLMALDGCLAKAKALEGIESEQDLARLRDEMILEAMVDLHCEDSQWLQQTQEMILDRGTRVRALYVTLEELGSGLDVRLSPEQGQKAKSLQELLGALIDRLEQAGSRTGDDRSGLEDQTNIRTKEPIEDVVLSSLGQLGSRTQQFLDGLMTDFVNVPTNGLPTWHTPEVLERLEQEVLRYVEHHEVDGAEARQHFREAIENYPGPPDGLPDAVKNKLYAALDALEAEANLAKGVAVQGLEPYSSIKPERLWKLFMINVGSKWDFEHMQQGSLAGLYRGFDFMLTVSDGKNRVSPDHLERLQIMGTKDSFRPSLSMSFISGQQTYVDDSRVEQWFREGKTTLDLPRDSFTEEGLKELEQEAGKFGCVFRSSPNEVSLEYPPRTREQSIARAREILEGFETKIQKEEGRDDKLHLIASTIRELYCSHLFLDGNTRTIVINLMNRMLLDNDLSPCILSDPKDVVYCSFAEFVEKIKDGQERFQDFALDPNNLRVEDDIKVGIVEQTEDLEETPWEDMVNRYRQGVRDDSAGVNNSGRTSERLDDRMESGQLFLRTGDTSDQLVTARQLMFGIEKPGGGIALQGPVLAGFTRFLDDRLIREALAGSVPEDAPVEISVQIGSIQRKQNDGNMVERPLFNISFRAKVSDSEDLVVTVRVAYDELREPDPRFTVSAPRREERRSGS